MSARPDSQSPAKNIESLQYICHAIKWSPAAGWRLTWPMWSWLAVSLVLWLVSPGQSERGVVAFTRFYVFTMVYAMSAWAMLCIPHARSLSPLQVMLAASAGLFFLSLLGLSLPERLTARTPHTFMLLIYLASYLLLLRSAGQLLHAWIPQHATPLLGLALLFAFTDLVWGEPILARCQEWRDLVWKALGYANPLLVVAACLPGYDAIRDTSLYTATTLAHHGPWRYPDPLYASLVYVVCSLLLRLVASWSNNTTSQASAAQGKNKIHQPT